MCRILVVGINYAPENISTGKYTSEMCTWLVSKGYEVRVITAPPYYPAWKVWPGYRTRVFRSERLEGVHVVRCPLWVPAVPRGFSRLIHLLSFAFTSAVAALASIVWRPRLVICIAPTLLCAPASWIVAKMSRARCWLHIQDFEVDAAAGMGIVESGWLRRVALAMERWLMRRFDKVSTISNQMLKRLGAKGVDSSQRVLFPNWVDIQTIRPLKVPSPYRKELGIPTDGVVALYSGNMGLKQGLEIVSQAAGMLAHRRDIYFVLGGQGPARAALELACEGLPNVRFLDLQPSARLNDWLGLADIHLLPQRADVADLVMPSKLTGMLASGRAILATAHPNTGVAEAIEGCGLAVLPGDIEAFVGGLESLASNSSLRLHMGSVARDRADALDRESILSQFDSLVAQMAGRNHPCPSSDATS